MSISDEIKEDAARALWNFRHPLDPWDSEHFTGPSDSERERTLAEVDAVFSAVAEDLIAVEREKCLAAATDLAACVAAMKAAAERAANPGPWFVHDFTAPEVNDDPCAMDVTISCDTPATLTVAEMKGGAWGYRDLEHARLDAAHIAASNPANVLALIEAYEALTAENSQLRQWYAEGLASIMSERDEATASRDALLALLSEAGETLKETLAVATRNEEGAFADRARSLSTRIAAKLKEGT